jgi:hypothetical protein
VRPIARWPAIGWAGTNRDSASPSVARAAAITSCLVLPDVGDDRVRAEVGRHPTKDRQDNCATGAATSTMSVVASIARPVIFESNESGR